MPAGGKHGRLDTGTVRNAPVVDLKLLPTRRRPASACDESPLVEPRVLG